MTTIDRKRQHVLRAVGFGAVLTLCSFSAAWAQEKHNIAYSLPTEASRFTQQHTIDVGDIPGHQVRIFEIHRTYPKDLLVVEGVRVLEEWVRGYSDFTDSNGPVWGYGTYVLEDGARIFTRLHGTSQSVARSDGSRKTTFHGVLAFAGGTGKFGAIRGTLRMTVTYDPIAGVVGEGEWQGEYWIAR